MRERELSYEEQMRWGNCPVCSAKDGEACRADIGRQLGRRADGSAVQDGDWVHLVRLRNAPVRVREVPL